jgi:hypothetical protein
MRKSIIGHEHHPIRRLLASRMGFPVGTSPLPVANYTSTIGVAADGAGSVMTWVGKYDAKGASDAEAKKVIDGIYDSGLKSLTAD